MKERESILLGWIKRRTKDNETTKCRFDITVPKLVNNLDSNKFIKEVCSLFDKYGIRYIKADTMPGAFNLNREWIETDDSTPIECAIEYPGAYPVEMEQNGDIIVRVSWFTKDGYVILNHYENKIIYAMKLLFYSAFSCQRK